MTRLPLSTKTWAGAAVVATLLACGAASRPPANVVKQVVTTPTPPVRTKVVQTTKEVRTDKKPDGYMTENDCYHLAEGTSVSDLMYHWGWPNGADEDDSEVGWLVYPLREDHSRFCQVSVWRGKVDSKMLDVGNGTTLSMGT